MFWFHVMPTSSVVKSTLKSYSSKIKISLSHITLSKSTVLEKMYLVTLNHCPKVLLIHSDQLKEFMIEQRFST